MGKGKSLRSLAPRKSCWLAILADWLLSPRCNRRNTGVCETRYADRIDSRTARRPSPNTLIKSAPADLGP